jgi:hypothetical protein
LANGPISIEVSGVTLGCYDGEDDFSCDGDPSTGTDMPKIDGGASYPTGMPVIRPHADNTTIQDIFVYNSAHHGIGQTTGGYDNLTVKRCRVEDAVKQGIFGKGTDNSTIGGSLADRNYVVNCKTENSGDCTSVGGACITCDGNCDGTTISYNIVWGCFGECIGGFGQLNTTKNIYEFNQVYNCRSVGIHFSDSKDIIRYNTVGVYDTGGDGYEEHFVNGTWPNCTDYNYTAGINVGGSTIYAAFASEYEIYGNIVYGHEDSAGVTCTLLQSQRTQGDTLQCYIYNNTLIDNGDNIRIHRDYTPTSGVTTYVKNNISVFYDISGTHCSIIPGVDTLDFDYNLFDSDPTDNDCEGVNDPSYADANLTTTSGYVWPTSYDQIDFYDVILQNNSPALNAGTDLGSTYNTDYFGNTRGQDGGWDIGALELEAAATIQQGIIAR